MPNNLADTPTRCTKRRHHAMTNFVTVRRDALFGLLDAAIQPSWSDPDEKTHERRLNDALAVMIVSPWREIDDEARNGQLWLISGFVEDNPEKGRWVVIGRWWPEHGYWTSEEDEPEGWEPEFYPPTLYAPIPELPK